jgi:uncharacterized membrane protein
MAENTGSDFFIAPSKKNADDFQTLIALDYQITITEWLKRGWEIFKKDAGPSIVFAVIAVVVYGASTWLIPFGIGSTVIGLPLLAGFIIIALMQLRNQKTQFAKYFGGFRHFVPLLLFTAVSTAFILIGIVFFVIPGIYATVAYLFSPFLIVDMNVDFWPAMEISRRKVNKHWFGMFAFCVVLVFINLLGCIPLGMGLFVTIPWTIYAAAIAYEDIFKPGTAPEAPAALHGTFSGPAPA